jgi:hypothetical protein
MFHAVIITQGRRLFQNDLEVSGSTCNIGWETEDTVENTRLCFRKALCSRYIPMTKF